MKKFFLIALSFLLVSCKMILQGTNTGNPDGVPTPSYGSEPTNGVLRLTYKICTQIETCYPQANAGTCMAQLMNLPGYTSELGPISNTFSSISSLDAAERNGSVLANSTNADFCYQGIASLTCSDPLVTGSYNPSSPADFSLTNRLLRSNTNCQTIY